MCRCVAIPAIEQADPSITKAPRNEAPAPPSTAAASAANDCGLRPGDRGAACRVRQSGTVCVRQLSIHLSYAPLLVQGATLLAAVKSDCLADQVSSYQNYHLLGRFRREQGPH